MKGKDYIYLAKVSLKANKRKKANTIFSLTCSLSFLIPIFFLLFAFYLGAIAKFNSVSAVLSIRLYQQDITEGNYNKIEELEGIKQRITYEDYVLRNNAYFIEDKSIKYTNTYICIDNQEIQVKYEDLPKHTATSVNAMFLGGSSTSTDYFKFFDISQPLFLESEEEYFRQMDYGELYVGELIQAEDEIMLSSRSLEILGLQAEDVLGKRISYKTAFKGTGYAACDDEGNLYVNQDETIEGETFYAFRNYKVVGIFNSRINQCPTRSFDSTEEQNSLEIWFNKASLYTNGVRNTPEYRLCFRTGVDSEIKAYQYDYLPTEYMESIVNQGKVYLPYGFNLQNEYSSYYYEEAVRDIFQFKDFHSVYRADSVIKDYLKVENTSILNSDLYNYIHLYPIINYISILFGGIGGLFFILMVLNLINTFQYYIRKRRGYTGIQKAMGLQDNEVRRLYYAEMLYMGIRASIYSLVVSLALCVGLFFYFRQQTETMSGFLPEIIGLNLGYYPLAYFIVIGIVLCVMLAINTGLCHKVSKQNIVELLKG